MLELLLIFKVQWKHIS